MPKILKAASNIPFIKPFIRNVIRRVYSKRTSKIANHLTQYLNPLIAESNELKEESFKIRHQVCCEELQALPIQSDLMESDHYDEHAIHCLVQHKKSGQYTGTIRIVYSRSTDELLPLEQFYLPKIYPDSIKPTDFPRDKICEASRLIVPQSFRRRSMDKVSGTATGAINRATYSEEELRCFPFIAVSLYLAAANVIIRNNFGHCFVMIEPRLAQSLDFVGIPFQQIGPAVNYFGERAGYFVDQETLEKKLPNGITRLREVIYEQLYPSHEAIEDVVDSVINARDK